MLRDTKELENYTIKATDGEIGHLKDLYFDDDTWVVRYLVVDTGSWLSSRKVLISPISVHDPNWQDKTLPVSITTEQVKNSPIIDTEKPVSRQQEEQYLGYYSYPYYWLGAGMWGGGMYPYSMGPGYAGHGMDPVEHEREMEAFVRAEHDRHRHDNPHLRSCEAVIHYHIAATDGEIGHVAGFLIDEQSWAIRYIIVDTGNWWSGHKMLVAPQWITGVRWSDRTVSVDLSRKMIEDSPVYDPAVLFTREQELKLYKHYGRRGYWAGSPELETET